MVTSYGSRQPRSLLIGLKGIVMAILLWFAADVFSNRENILRAWRAGAAAAERTFSYSP